MARATPATRSVVFTKATRAIGAADGSYSTALRISGAIIRAPALDALFRKSLRFIVSSVVSAISVHHH
jgi:hypothetical protein